jgi:diaphanous 1
LEVHEAEQRRKKAQAKAKAKIQIPSTPQATETVCDLGLLYANSGLTYLKTVKTNPNILLTPAASGKRSIGRGDVEQAIRSVRAGMRTTKKHDRPLSKIFMDGGTSMRHSRLYEP